MGRDEMRGREKRERVHYFGDNERVKQGKKRDDIVEKDI